MKRKVKAREVTIAALEGLIWCSAKISNAKYEDGSVIARVTVRVPAWAVKKYANPGPGGYIGEAMESATNKPRKRRAKR